MNIEKKKLLAREKIINKHGCQEANVCLECLSKIDLIERLYISNIPCEYWFLNKSKIIDTELQKIIQDYINNLKNNFANGISICMVGNHGVGKSMSACYVLRNAIKNKFTSYYITSYDLFSEVIENRNGKIKEILKNTDFVVIDEIDSRFFCSDSMKEIFSGIFEGILRHRVSNELPTILCSNDTESVYNIFYGQCVQSMQSLFKKYIKIIPVAGKDLR